ncbi:uncharacterized protein C8Q71DRAFT_703988 [Rhodofomes roseus]|uniref:Reverse transcriptase zinc-binding domain-containing protein n=1 Tax=Rhodofomes roseus TaxID=34475 RepID=A0ABQ8KLH8_9APHY|nr:uncharacterized protein C8Q71DRAFT_703988 [Rhodofomes roseus]KAH9839066.1 hypothetical protein C8Q71DRAFT_703988 [Rhodofomes roseus]
MPPSQGFVYYPSNVRRSTAVRPADEVEESQHPRGEIVAAIRAINDTPMDVPLHIISSKDTLSRDLTERLSKWEDKGWIGISGTPFLKTLVNKLRQRCAPTKISKAAEREQYEIRNTGHDLQKAAYSTGQTEQIHPEINISFDLSGAKIGTLTQARAYQGIRENQREQTRERTSRRVKKTLERLHMCEADTHVTEAMLWKSIRQKDIHRKVVDFLWKGTHDALRIGSFWTHIPGYEERANCPTCGTLESLEHILTECTAPGRREVWMLTKNLWKRTRLKWTQPHIEDILAIGLGRYALRKGKKRRESRKRLWRIIVSEAAYLIWKLRCERVIGHEDDDRWTHTTRQIIQKWYLTMNRRLQQDLVATNRKFGALATMSQVVLGTWSKTIGDEQGLPPDWTKIPRVLVGIDPEVCGIDVDPG